MAAKNDLHSILCLALAINRMISCYFLCNLSFVESQENIGFSVELIHRDSPKSPFFNRLETTSERRIKALKRSIRRVNHFIIPSNYISKNHEAKSDMFPDQGEYLMNISIGTPSFDILAIADTGSDLIWTQCYPCPDCYEQDAPLFNPNASLTYRKLSCSSSQCKALGDKSCSIDQANDACLYSISYGDRSFSKGDLAIDTITLGSSTTGRSVALPRTIFGCGHNNGGTFSEKGSGIIGLGRGAASLVSQIGTSIAGKFSYCLVPFSSESDSKSKINFGTNAIVSGSGVVSTPLVRKSPEVFYYLTLEGISVDDDKLEFTGSSLGRTEGNILIDSGTTLTLLPPDCYSKLETLVASKIDAKRIDAPIESLSLCYEADQSDLEVPNITVHFSKADVKLSPLNTFISVSKGISCFTFSSFSGLSIYGNLAQMNFLIGYDIENQVVSFKPTDCTKD